MSDGPRARSGFYGWIARRPRRAFWTTLLAALFLGIGIGGAAGSDAGELDAAKANGQAAKGRLAAIEADRDQLRADLGAAERRADKAQERIAELTAKAEVPDFVGTQAGSARGHELVKEIEWDIKTVQEVTGSAAPGTVLAQSPKPGRTLKRGQAITLTAAKEPPPKPKQWVTIKTLQGGGATKTEEFTIPSGLKARLVYSMPDDLNNAITLYKAPDEYIDLLLNEIGSQQGETRLYRPGTFYLDVTGSYTIEVQVFKRPT